MKFKYIQNSINDIKNLGEATMLLYEDIGADRDMYGDICGGIDGSSFAYEMQYLQDYAKFINVRINSCGGSVMDGYSIISAIKNSKIPVYTYIDGIAASIAAVIAMCGQEVSIMDFGSIMIHNPYSGDGDDTDDAVLSLIKDTLVTILKNNTDLSADELSVLMDRETWISAKEAKKMGMVQEIISSKISTADKQAIEDKQAKSNVIDLYKIYNSILNKNKKETMIDNENTLIEEVNGSINVEDLQKSLDEMKNEIESLKKEKEALTLEVNKFNSEKEAEKKAKVEELVNSYILSGKIKEDEKEMTIKMASFDFEGTKNMLDKIGSKTSNKISTTIKNESSNKDDKSTWTLRDWEKNDPKGLSELKNSNEELFNEMYKTFYKNKK